MKKTTFIVLAWVLVCCGFSYQSYAQINQVNSDSNTSRVLQTGISSERSASVTSKDILFLGLEGNAKVVSQNTTENRKVKSIQIKDKSRFGLQKADFIAGEGQRPTSNRLRASDYSPLFTSRSNAGSECVFWVSPSPTTGYVDFNTNFGGAPTTADGCPFNEITDFQVWASEAYTTGGFVTGNEYTFSICNGSGAGSWVPDFTIIAPSGAVDAFGAGDGDGCSITWTATESGTYFIVINEATFCGGGTNQATDNGFPALTCTAGGGGGFPAPYCGPNVFINDIEPLTLVEVAGISNVTDATVNANPSHEDFTAIVGTMEEGMSYPITLEGNTAGNFINRFVVFVDWNQNEVLDDAGEVYEITELIENSTGTDGIQAAGTIVVPAGVTAGDTRIRVKKIFGTTNYLDPCLGTGFGQTEDYTIAVITGGGGSPTCTETAATAVPLEIDGAENATADCAAAPNLVPVAIAESGIIGTDAVLDFVQIDILHTFSSDLDLFLVSPLGTELLLSDDNGGGTDDGYNMTQFSDGGADITAATAPFGTGPYAAEGGSFAMTFAGEQINGDWQLKVCDDAGGDTGTVQAFSVQFCNDDVPPPPSCEETAATAVPLEIDGAENATADCAAAPNLVPVAIAESGIIGIDVVLDFAQIDILHTFSSDLDLFLVSPLGTELLLSDDNGGGTDDGYNMTQFSDGGADITAATAPFGTGPYAAEGGSFAAAFNGEEINGDWQLKVCDVAGGDTGTVQAFSLQFCPPPTCPEVINVVVTPTLTDAAISWDAQAAATNGYIVAVFADDADPMTATPVYNEIIAAGTTMTTATGLTASTSYDLYVTLDCGANGLSAVNSIDFNTLIALPACGGKFYDTGGPDNDFDNDEAYQVNILPDNPGDLVVATFQLVNTGGGGFDMLLVDIGDGVFVQVPEVDVSAGDDPVVFTSIAADGALLFDFFSSGVVPNPGWDADITCDAPPACPSPTGFMVDGITSSSADFSWDAVAEASSGYILRVFNEGDDPTMDTPVADENIAAGMTSITIMGLMGVTSYDAYLRADCDTDGTSIEVDLTFTSTIENDLCEDAIAIDCGGSASGTTTGATPDEGVAGAECGATITAPGVWYAFTDSSGLLATVTATLCNGTGYDSKISVFEGDCAALVCVDGNDDDCGVQSSISWESDGTSTYYILVHGFGGATGNYVLDVSCVPVLGLEDTAVEGFTYFPNPSSDVLNLNATNNIDTVSIYNLLGQLVLSQKVDATRSQLNISKFSTGSYIMKVTSNGVTGSYKVIKR